LSEQLVQAESELGQHHERHENAAGQQQDCLDNLNQVVASIPPKNT
jgi:hypothetical protein